MKTFKSNLAECFQINQRNKRFHDLTQTIVQREAMHRIWTNGWKLEASKNLGTVLKRAVGRIMTNFIGKIKMKKKMKQYQKISCNYLI